MIARLEAPQLPVVDRYFRQLWLDFGESLAGGLAILGIYCKVFEISMESVAPKS